MNEATITATFSPTLSPHAFCHCTYRNVWTHFLKCRHYILFISVVSLSGTQEMPNMFVEILG